METCDIVVKVDIPFCVSPCECCRREIIPGWNSARMGAYVKAVVAEIDSNAGQFDDCRVRAVRFGGGTASNAGAGVADIARALRRALPMADDVEVTMRSSIANVSGATMPFFRRAGIGRFDFEMLSLNPVGFTRLNSVDNLNDLPIICDHFLHAYSNDSLGFVLAYGLGVSDVQDGVLNVRRTALAAARSHATHVELVRREPSAEGGACQEEAALQLAEMREVLLEHGFAEYLPLRVARPGKEDRFSLELAAGRPLVGFGLGAVTRFDGAESANTRDLATYCEHSDDFSVITANARALSLVDSCA